MATERVQGTPTPFVTEFDISLEGITPAERLLSDTLCLAAVSIAPIYALQKNDQYPGANFYPHDVSKEEVEVAASSDPEILSEYTLVKKEGTALTTVPYHVEYRSQLESTAALLMRASTLTDDPNFAHYLTLRSESLLDGDYEKSESVWLGIPESVCDIVIGPYDRYDDRLFSRKYAYQAWTGIIDREETELAQRFVDSFLEVYGWQGRSVRARVDKTRVFAGLAAGGWSANNLPCQMDWRERHGSKVTIFLPSFRQRFEQRLPDLHRIWPRSRNENQDSLERNSRIFLFAHESCHPIVRRLGDEQRLKGQYSAVSELYCDVLGIFTSIKLIGKELTEKDWELLLPNYFAWGLNRFKTSGDSATFSAYLVGGASALNYLLSTGAMGIENGEVQLAPSEMLERHLGELVNELEYLMAVGNEEEATDFFNRFADVQKFTSLA